MLWPLVSYLFARNWIKSKLFSAISDGLLSLNLIFNWDSTILNYSEFYSGLLLIIFCLVLLLTSQSGLRFPMARRALLYSHCPLAGLGNTCAKYGFTQLHTPYIWGNRKPLQPVSTCSVGIETDSIQNILEFTSVYVKSVIF